MSPAATTALQALVSALPPGSAVMVTREWLEGLLDGTSASPEPSAGTLPPADLTVRQVGERLGRAPSTIRAWIQTGALRAYRLQGREHRVTLQALQEFEEAQRGSPPGRPVSNTRRVRRADLTAWRKVAS